MEPLNKTDRQQAIRRFLGVYCLSLTAPLLAAYFLFSSPTQVLKEENTRLKKTLDEQSEKLIKRMDAVTKHLDGIEIADQAYVKATDIEKGSLKTRIDGLENGVQQELNGIKTDSSAFEPVNKQISGDAIASYEAVLTYRHSINDLRNILDQKGIDVQQMQQLRSDFEKVAGERDQMRRENDLLKIMAAKQSAGGGGGGGAPAADCSPFIAQIGRQKDQIAQLEAKLRTTSSAPASVPVSTPTPTNSYSGPSKYDIEFDVIERCERKADNNRQPPLWRRPLYEFAVELLENNPRQDAKKKISTITEKLRRLNSD